MTTTVGNNSVFRSFFEKQKLTGPNFIDWYRQLRLVLSTKDKENYLEHPIPCIHHLKKRILQRTPFATNVVKLAIGEGTVPYHRGLRGSKKLKPGALSLYVGNGNRAAVEAIRAYHLELLSGLVIV
ncbi:hypothetical protein Tco_1222746 [Tanacetum coccineum]